MSRLPIPLQTVAVIYSAQSVIDNGGLEYFYESELDDLTPLQAARKHGHEEFVALFLRLGVKDPRRPFWWRWLPV